MKPVRPIAKGIEATSTLVASGCGDLPVYKGTDGSGSPVIISRWHLTLRERLRLLVRGSIWLGVMSSDSQPPVYLTTANPFEDN